MASEPIECQVVVLKVSIHCEGCKKKVKKVLQHINGVFRCEIDARSNKIMVTASTKLDPYVIVAKLRKSGKQADLWPEQPIQQQPPPPAESQEPKNQAEEQSKPNEPAEKPGADTAEAAAAGPSNPQPPPEPQQSTAGETAKPAQESKQADGANGNTGGEAPAAPGAEHQHHHPSEAKWKATQHPPEMEKKPVDARVTVEYDRGIGGYGGSNMPPPPQHVVMSYNQARPSMSASYYAPSPAPAPAPMPTPMARPGPSQGYIDEHYTPSYYSRPSPAYEPYYYNPPQQPSPYRYQYDQGAPSSSEDYYYYSAPPQRSAFSPPRDGYGDMFNDENANSCSVM